MYGFLNNLHNVKFFHKSKVVTRIVKELDILLFQVNLIKLILLYPSNDIKNLLEIITARVFPLSIQWQSIIKKKYFRFPQNGQ